MKKGKRNVKQTRDKRDHLSELPDSLILSILGLLPMRDVVRTTILSKRWENLWTTVTCLNIDDSMKAGIVEQVLKSWRGVKILKFKIDHPSTDRWRSLTSRHVDSWVRFAMDHKVEELSMHLRMMHVRKGDSDHNPQFGPWKYDLYCVPQDLYSCSLLKELSFKSCRFDIKDDVRVQWNQLKNLSIHCSGLHGNTISRILCGSPQLEICHLALTKSNGNLIIRSTTLRRLSIDTYFCDVEGSNSPELVIWTPNLETLEMLGILYPKCLLMDVSSLTHATLGFYYGVDDALRQILPKIQHVERLTLVHWCTIKAVVAVKKELWPNVKLLELMNVGCVGLEAVVDVVKMFSEVKTLVVKSGVTKYRHSQFSSLNVERDLPNSFVLQLRTVEVTWSNGDDTIFPFIEFVLKYASNLEKMVFREETPRKSYSLWELQKLHA